MTLAILAAVSAVLAFYLYSRPRKAASETERDSTPALDTWLGEALEGELAEHVLGLQRSTPEERRKLAGTLANEPDPDVVSQIEEKVKAVELEFVRYAHEADAEVTMRVRYEDGATGVASRRLAAADLPEAVRADFEKKGSTRVFRTWAFPWQRVAAL